MGVLSRRALIVGLGCVGAIVVACEPADIEGSGLAGTFTVASPTEPTSTGICEGPAKLEVTDPATLPSCCDGAHCLAKDKVPGKVRRSLAECPGGYCVPDSFLRTGGAPAAKCTAFGKEGACASKCIPEVAKNVSLLQQDTCGAGDLCAPCINPITNAVTGICELGKGGNTGCNDDAAAPPPTKCPHEGPPVIDPMTLPSCGEGAGAHCLDAKLVSPAMAGKLAKCDTGLCVPDVFIASGGQFIPKTCVSVGGGEGRCLSEVLPDIGAQEGRLPRATCGGRELCAPCFSPVDGSDTGACRQSCDPGPKEKPYLFPTCCTQAGTARGRCVPSATVSDKERPNLTPDVCASSSDLCAPRENLDPTFVPKACSAFSAVYFGNYAGVCLSTCLHFTGLNALAVAKGNCDDLHQCVPCKGPTGTPTGAPGCVP